MNRVSRKRSPVAVIALATAALAWALDRAAAASGDAEHASCDPAGCITWTLHPWCRYQTLSVPATDPPFPLRSAEDVVAEIPDVVSVTKQFYHPGGCRSYTYHADTGACTTTPAGCPAPEPGAESCGSSCFCLEEGAGLQLERDGDRPFLMFGGDTSTHFRLEGDYSELISVPYTSGVRTAAMLFRELGGADLIAWVARVNCDGTLTTWFPGVPKGNNFDIVPGEAYLVQSLLTVDTGVRGGVVILGPQCDHNAFVLEGPATGLAYSWGVDLSYDLPYGPPVDFEATDPLAPGLPPGSAGFEMSQAFVDELRRADHPDLWAQVDRNDPSGTKICVTGRPQAPVLWVGPAGGPPDCDVNDAGPCSFDGNVWLAEMPFTRLRPLLTELTWLDSGTYFDVVRGDLDTLRITGGDFATAAEACIADDYTEWSIPDPFLPPEPGTGAWYLVRDFNAYADHGYDGGGPGQVRPRDALYGAPNGCLP